MGDIGDVFWAIPAFGVLKDAFPQALLSVLVRNHNGEFLLDDFHSDRLFTVDHKKDCDGKGINQCLDELSEEKVKEAVDQMLEKFS